MDDIETKQNEELDNGAENPKKSLNICCLLSFIFSLVGLLIFGLPLGLAAIVLGIIGIVKFDATKQKYKWMGIVGIVIGVFNIFGVILSVVKLASML